MFDDLFTKLEQAIDAHPAFVRLPAGDPSREPVMLVERGSFSVRIRVRVQRSRKKPSEIWGRGDTAEEAVDDLIAGLDPYAQAMDWKP